MRRTAQTYPAGTIHTNERGYQSVKLSKADWKYIYTVSGWIHVHRAVMMDSLERRLYRGERVIHENGDKTDNQIGNLVLIGKPDWS